MARKERSTASLARCFSAATAAMKVPSGSAGARTAAPGTRRSRNPRARRRPAKARAYGGASGAPTRLSEIESDRRGPSSLRHRRAGPGPGGGLVPGSLVLIGGDPGIGKSTLALQLAVALGKRGASGALRLRRGVPAADADARGADRAPGRRGAPLAPSRGGPGCDRGRGGTPSARAPGRGLHPDPGHAFASRRTGQRGAGAGVRAPSPASGQGPLAPRHPHRARDQGWRVAGPRTLEHMVDVVLYLEGDGHTSTVS